MNIYEREVEIMKTITREIAGHHWLHFSSDNFDKDEFKLIKKFFILFKSQKTTKYHPN